MTINDHLSSFCLLKYDSIFEKTLLICFCNQNKYKCDCILQAVGNKP